MESIIKESLNFSTQDSSDIDEYEYSDEYENRPTDQGNIHVNGRSQHVPSRSKFSRTQRGRVRRACPPTARSKKRKPLLQSPIQMDQPSTSTSRSSYPISTPVQQYTVSPSPTFGVPTSYLSSSDLRIDSRLEGIIKTSIRWGTEQITWKDLSLHQRNTFFQLWHQMIYEEEKIISDLHKVELDSNIGLDVVNPSLHDVLQNTHQNTSVQNSHPHNNNSLNNNQNWWLASQNAQANLSSNDSSSPYYRDSENTNRLSHNNIQTHTHLNKNNNRNDIYCDFCEKVGHTFDECYKKPGVCSYCRKKGHMSAECKMKLKTQTTSGRTELRSRSRKILGGSGDEIFENDDRNDICCDFCKIAGHTIDECYRKKGICSYCKIKGHINAECKMKHKTQTTSGREELRSRSRSRSWEPRSRKVLGGSGDEIFENDDRNDICCDFCKIVGHTIDECYKMKGVCSYCKRKGHIRAECPEKHKTQTTSDRAGLRSLSREPRRRKGLGGAGAEIFENNNIDDIFCDYCEKVGHTVDECYKKQGLCSYCKKKGHIRADCRSKS